MPSALLYRFARDRFNISREDLDQADSFLRRVYADEACYPDTSVTAQQVRLNLEHSERVRANAAAIARGEGLNTPFMEMAAILHDVAKLNHRERRTGGIDTWQHHRRGARLARRWLRFGLGKSEETARLMARTIEAHSDIPFISRHWQRTYGVGPVSPRTPEEFALRDADLLDLIWVGGLVKIVHIRQMPGSVFYQEDQGDIRKAIASAQTSFEESVAVLSLRTARVLAEARISTVSDFLARVAGVRSLGEFDHAFSTFDADHPPGKKDFYGIAG